MVRTSWFAIALAALALAGCGSKGEAASSGGGGGGGGGGSGEPSEDTPAAAAPEALRDYDVHLDLLRQVHMADVDHHGLFIDMGTPAQRKYTVGDWNSGWGSSGNEGTTTFAYVGRRGRLYFHADQPGAMTVRLRLRAHGTAAMTPYINNSQIQSVHFEENAGFRDYDFQLPADQVVRGENNLLLTFGGTTRVGNEDVAVALDSVRIVRGDAVPAGELTAPTWPSLLAEANVGGARRRAVVVNRPTTISYYVQVPPSGKLGFAVGLENGASGQATAKVRVTPEGGSAAEVFSRAVSGEWHEAAVDLNAFAGKIVRVDLVAEGSGSGRLAWGAPGIYVPKPEQRERPRHAKNVVVLLIDTLRADKLRPFNPRSRVRTPVVDRLAQEGAVFELAQSPENWTKPSVASVLTSLFPMTHGTKQSESRLPADALMLSEHYKANGFSTASFLANGYVSDRFGFDQGWDHYTNYIRESKSTEAENVFDEAADWIEAHKDRRFFVYIQTIDPHVPYDPPAEYLQMYDQSEYTGPVRPRSTADQLEQAKRNPPAITFTEADRRRLEALHDGEISYHDHWLGQFIERMKQAGIWDDTVFVITSDHGEEFDDHGSWGHGHSVYQELLHVPLMFRMPGAVPANLRVPHVVSTMDIAPTVLELTGIAPLPAAEGRSLLPYLAGRVPAGPQLAFSDFLDDRRVVTASGFKLIVRGNLTSTFFDLNSDPGEQRELPITRHPIAARFTRIALGQFLGAKNRARWMDAEQLGGTRLDSESAQMDDTIRAQLRALGYAN